MQIEGGLEASRICCSTGPRGSMPETGRPMTAFPMPGKVNGLTGVARLSMTGLAEVASRRRIDI